MGVKGKASQPRFNFCAFDFIWLALYSGLHYYYCSIVIIRLGASCSTCLEELVAPEFNLLLLALLAELGRLSLPLCLLFMQLDLLLLFRNDALSSLNYRSHAVEATIAFGSLALDGPPQRDLLRCRGWLQALVSRPHAMTLVNIDYALPDGPEADQRLRVQVPRLHLHHPVWVHRCYHGARRSSLRGSLAAPRLAALS